MDDICVVPDFLRYWAQRTPDKPAFIFRSPDSAARYVLTYGDLYLLAGRWARVLHERGIGPGQFVVNALPNSPEHAVVEFGILMSGAASVDGCRCDLSDASDLVTTLSQSRASSLVIDPDFYGEKMEVSANETRWRQAFSGFDSTKPDKMAALKSYFLSGPDLDGSVQSEMIPDLKFVFTVHRGHLSTSAEEKRENVHTKAEAFEENGHIQADSDGFRQLFKEGVDFLTALKKCHSLTHYHADGNEDDVCTVVTTSGTTGPPKLVVFTHGSWVSLAKAYARPPGVEFNTYLMGRAVGYVANSVFKGSTRVLCDSRAEAPTDMVEFVYRSVTEEGITSASLLAVYHQPLAEKIAESGNMEQSHARTPQLQRESVAAAVVSHAIEDTSYHTSTGNSSFDACDGKVSADVSTEENQEVSVGAVSPCATEAKSAGKASVAKLQTCAKRLVPRASQEREAEKETTALNHGTMNIQGKQNEKEAHVTTTSKKQTETTIVMNSQNQFDKETPVRSTQERDFEKQSSTVTARERETGQEKQIKETSKMTTQKAHEALASGARDIEHGKITTANHSETPFLRHIGLGSQPITKQMVQTASEIAQGVFISYACTELFFIANHFVTDPDQYRDYFVGKPLPDVDVRVCGATGREADAGEQGEIEVKTPYRFREYLHQPALTASAFTPDGYFRTGDIGWFDVNGGLYVLGRSGEVITHGNIQIHPGWLEQRIRACPGVKDVLVVGIPHPVLISELCACVMMDSPDVTLTHVQQFVEDDVSVQRKDLLSARPRYYLALDTFPLTPAGKVDRKQVQKMAVKQLGKDA